MNKKRLISLMVVLILLINVSGIASASTTKTYSIDTVEELLSAIEDINNGNITADIVVLSIEANINLTGVSSFESINTTSSTAFSIKIYSINSNTYTITLDGKPLFNNMTNATVTSLNLAGNVSGSGSSTGALANAASGSTISNVTNSANVTNTSGGSVGGLIGSTSGTVTISNASNSGTISGGTAGGIVGSATGTTTFSGTCTNTGTIKGTVVASDIIGQASSGTSGNTSFTLELSDQATATSTWKDGDFSLDLSKYTTNTSGKTCTYSLVKSSSYYTLNTSTGVLKVSNNSSTAMDVGTYTIDVDITANNVTTREQVTIKIASRTFAKSDFTLSSGTKTYDGTIASVQKTITSSIWSSNDYTVDYKLNMSDWTVTLTVTPVTSRTNVPSSATALVYTYSVESGITIDDTDMTTNANGALTFASSLSSSKVIVKKDGVSDGCIYEGDISFYQDGEGNYSYSAYTGTSQ